MTADQLDFTGEMYEKLGLDQNTVVEPGDFLSIYSGDLNNPEGLAMTGYGCITSVTESDGGLLIAYDPVSEETMLSSADMYIHEDSMPFDLTDEQLDQISRRLEEDILKSKFVDDMTGHITKLITAEEETLQLDSEYKDALTGIKFERDDGSEITLEEIRELAGGATVEVDLPIKANFTGSLNLQHFDKKYGFRAVGSVDTKITFHLKEGANIVIRAVAMIELEIALGPTFDFEIVKDTWLIFPYIDDVRGKVGISAGVYIGLGFTLTVQTKGDEQKSFKEAIDSIDENNMVNMENYMLTSINDKTNAKILKNFGTGLSDKMKNIAQAAKIGTDAFGFSAIPGKITKRSTIEMDDDNTTISDTYKDNITLGGGFEEKYSNFMQGSDAEYVPLFKQELLTAEFHDPSGIAAVSITISLFVEFKINVMLGFSLTYEKEKEASITFEVFSGKKEKTVGDLRESTFQVDVFLFGMIGVQAGIEFDFRVGIISTRIASIGLVLRIGAYVEFYGFFYFAYKIVGDHDPVKEMFGAMQLQIGIFLEIKFRAQLGGGALQKDINLYSVRWPLLTLGPEYVAIDFAKMAADDERLNLTIEARTDQNKNQKSTENHVIGGASIKVPDDLFNMKMLKISSGEIKDMSVDADVAYRNQANGAFKSGDFKYFQDDEEHFRVQFTPKGKDFSDATAADKAKGGFVYYPETNLISAKPANMDADELWGEFTFTYYEGDHHKTDAAYNYGAGFSLNTRVLTRTVRIHWTGTPVTGTADIMMSTDAGEKAIQDVINTYYADGVFSSSDSEYSYSDGILLRSYVGLNSACAGKDYETGKTYFEKKDTIQFHGFDGTAYFMETAVLAGEHPGYRLACSKEKYHPEAIQNYKDRRKEGFSNDYMESIRSAIYKLETGTNERGWMLVIPSDPYLFFMMQPNTKVQLYFIKGYIETDWYVTYYQEWKKGGYYCTYSHEYKVAVPMDGNLLDYMPEKIKKEVAKETDGYEYTWFYYSDKDGKYQNARLPKGQTAVDGASADCARTCMPTLEQATSVPADSWKKLTADTRSPITSTVVYAVRVAKPFTLTYHFSSGVQSDVFQVRYKEELPTGTTYLQKPNYIWLGWFDENMTQYLDTKMTRFYTMPAHDVDLYPQYNGVEKEYTWWYDGKKYTSKVPYGDVILAYAPDIQIANSKKDGGNMEIRWFGSSSYYYEVQPNATANHLITTYYGRLYGYRVAVFDERNYINTRDYQLKLSAVQNAKGVLRPLKQVELDAYIIKKGLVTAKLNYASEEKSKTYILPVNTSEIKENPGYEMYFVDEDGTEINNTSLMPAKNVTLYVKWRPKVYTYVWLSRNQYYDENGAYVCDFEKLAEIKSDAIKKTIGDIRPDNAKIKDKDTRYIWKMYRYSYNARTLSRYVTEPETSLNYQYWNQYTAKNSDKLPEHDTIFILDRQKRTVKVTWKYKDGDETKDWWIARKLEAPRNQTWYDEMYNIVGWADEDGNTYEYPPLELERLVLYPILEEHEHAWQLIRRLPASCDQVGIDEYECQLCHKTRQDELPMIDHYVLYWNDNEPTCTERGCKVGYCSNCEQWVYEYYGEPLGHDFDTGLNGGTIATCTTDGSYSEFDACKRCGLRRNEKTSVIPALGHDEEEIHENEVANTCTTDGYYEKVIRCRRCGEELSRETVVLPAHGHIYHDEVTEPTCTEKGYTTHTCMVGDCGYSYTDTETDPLGHDYQKAETVAPTCKDDGYTVYKCSRCTDSYKGDIVLAANTEHVPGEAKRTEPYPIIVEDEYHNKEYKGWMAGDITTRCTICEAIISTEIIKVVPKAENWQYGKNLTMELLQRWKNGGATTLGDVGNIYGDYYAFAATKDMRSDDRWDIDAEIYFVDSTKAIADIHSGDQLKIHIKPMGDYTKTYAEADVTLTVVGDEHVHNLTEIKANDATCSESGNSAYWACTGCPKFFSDAEGTTEIEENSWVIAAKGHKPFLTATAEKAAVSCQEPGNSAYWTCGSCGKYFSDAEGTTEIDENSWIIPGEHTNGDTQDENYVAPTSESAGSVDHVVYCGLCKKEKSRITEILKWYAKIVSKGPDLITTISLPAFEGKTKLSDCVDFLHNFSTVIQYDGNTLGLELELLWENGDKLVTEITEGTKLYIYTNLSEDQKKIYNSDRLEITVVN